MKPKFEWSENYFFLLDEDSALPSYVVDVEKTYWNRLKPNSPKLEVIAHLPRFKSEPINGLPLLPPIDGDRVPIDFQPTIGIVHCDRCPGGFDKYIQTVTMGGIIYVLGQYLYDEK